MSFYRFAAKEGFHPADFNLFRNGFSLIVSIIWVFLAGTRPFADFPFDRKLPLWWRIFFGQGNFLLLNMAAPLAPLTLVMVFRDTSPFWISIFAYILLKEPI